MEVKIVVQDYMKRTYGKTVTILLAEKQQKALTIGGIQLPTDRYARYLKKYPQE